MPPKPASFHTVGLLVCLILAAVGRALLIASGSVSFHADEATVALMARHILQGEFPIFFYGQAYMGSLNALPLAAAFAILGESVLTIRVVQAAVFVLSVAVGYWAAWRLSANRTVTLVAGLTLALSPTVAAIYTAVNIGSYTETLIFGAITLVLAYDLTHDHAFSGWRWLALGAVVGVAWWANGLIIVYALPALVAIAWRLVRGPRRGAYVAWMLAALAAFVVGSGLWWWHNLTHDFAALRFFLPSSADPAPGEVVPVNVPLADKALGLLLFAMPTTIGLRYTWASSYFFPLLGLPVLLIYVVAVYQLARTNAPPLRPGARPLLFGMMALHLAVFLLSAFGTDATGRYMIPLLFPLGLCLGTFSAFLREHLPGRGLWAVPMALVLAFNAAGQINAALRNDPGLTTQFDLATHIPNDHDAALIAFLQQHGITHGYTSYWLSPRLAFLSAETIQLAATLPNKPDLSYNPVDQRDPAYTLATDNADPRTLAYINVETLPQLDAVLLNLFAQAGVTDYQVERVGPYVVYYDFVPAAPRLRFNGTQPPTVDPLPEAP